MYIANPTSCPPLQISPRIRPTTRKQPPNSAHNSKSAREFGPAFEIRALIRPTLHNLRAAFAWIRRKEMGYMGRLVGSALEKMGRLVGRGLEKRVD
eukprot:688293-Rhodomonas_salina.1